MKNQADWDHRDSASNSALAEAAARFVRGGVAIACERHAEVVRAFATCLARGQECPDDLLLEVDESVRCVECSLIASAVLSEPLVDLAEVPSVYSQSSRLGHTSGAAPNVEGHSAPERTSETRQVVPFRRAKQPEPLIARPRLPSQPYCPTPVRLAAKRKWKSVKFDKEQPLELDSAEMPAPAIEHGSYPVVVTTPYRAQLEYAKGNDWHVALPLSPQSTRIVIHRESRLYDASHGTGFRDEALISNLGGSVLAVADRTSSYASRLILAARQGGATETFVPLSAIPEATSRESRTVYLLQAPYFTMVDLLADGVIDGFSTVEPFPTLAKFRLGEQWAEATLNETCTSASGGFCCVVMVPAELNQYPDDLDALLKAIITSICSLLKPSGFNRLVKLFAHTLKAQPAPRTSFDLRTIASEAAVSTLRHFTEHLQPLPDNPQLYAEALVRDLPIEAIRAESSALAPHLSEDDYFANLKGIVRLGDPKSNLFDFSRARDIFIDVITEAGQHFEGQVSSLTKLLDKKGRNHG